MSSIGSVSGDPTVELALLMIDNADRLSDLEQRNLEGARTAMERASAREIEALNDAADAVAMGAVVQGSLTVLGGGSSTIATVRESEAVLRIGETMSASADPMGRLAGDVPSRHADALAAKAKHDRELASLDAEDARNATSREERQANTVLDRVGEILDSEARGKLAILGNF
jgi:hypothetical protein